MTARRPLVLSGNFTQEADNTDAIPLLGNITYGSGFNNLGPNSLAFNSRADLYLAPQASGLIFAIEGGDAKLADDGQTAAFAEDALLSGVAALEGVAPAYASGLEAQRIAVDALASGNAALLANVSGIQQASAALEIAEVALASGVEAYQVAQASLNINNMKLQNSLNVLDTCSEANVDAVHALASGNAALEILTNNPFISENDLIGLIFSIS